MDTARSPGWNKRRLVLLMTYMPWYYASPEAKPVGPVSLDELHARRANGTISPETYVIEHTVQPTENWAWKRYKDLFPATPNPGPLIPSIGSVPPPPPPVPPLSPAGAGHPLFPSAGSAASHQPAFPTHGGSHPYHAVKPANGWCAWGFGLGLAGLFLSMACGIGLLLAVPSIFLCITGLVQVHKNRGQSGQGLAIAGLILSLFAIVISIFIVVYALKFKGHGFPVTEQTSSDSE